VINLSYNKYHLLNYDHSEIQNILTRVYNGKLLTKDDYDHLINRIGLKNISTFDGYYNSLIGTPDIEYMIDVAIAENNSKVMETIKSDVDGRDKVLVELLDKHIAEYKKLLDDLNTGMIKLDKDTKEYINSSVEAINRAIKEHVNQLEESLKGKADEEHIHLIDDILELYDVLELKAAKSHVHETDHVHTNKGTIDAINDLTIKKWDAKADIDDIPTKLSELVNDLELLDEKALKEYLELKLPNFNDFLTRLEVDLYLEDKANKNHTHLISHVPGLSDELSRKVDKKKGYTLVAQELLNKIQEYMNRVDVDNEEHIHEFTDPETGEKRSNVEDLNHIDLLRIKMWDDKIDQHQLDCILEEYTTTEIIKNYYSKSETYSKQEIEDLITLLGLNTISERLDGLTFVAVETKEEWDALSEEEISDPKTIYIKTFGPDIEEEYMTAQMFDDRFNERIAESDGVVTDDELEERLGGLTFIPVTQVEYNNISDDKKGPEFVYIITDGMDDDTSLYVTEEVVNQKILDAQLGDMTIILDDYITEGELEKALKDYTLNANQIDLSDYVKKEEGKSLIADEEIQRIALLENANYQFKVNMVDAEEPEVILTGQYPNVIVTINLPIPKVENNTIDLTAVNAQIDARLDGMTIDMITEEEYNALSDADKNNPSKLFIVTNPSENPVVDVSELVTKQELENRLNGLSELDRPEQPVVGQCYFDAKVGLPLWFNGKDWIDAMGNVQ
jgi:hypothetical protein